MRYVMARFESEFQQTTYRIFVTDYLQALGRFQGPRYKEVIDGVHQPIETRSSEEIISDIKGKLLKLGD